MIKRLIYPLQWVYTLHGPSPYCAVHGIAAAEATQSHVFIYQFRPAFSQSNSPYTSSHIEVRDAISPASISGFMTHPSEMSSPDRQR